MANRYGYPVTTPKNECQLITVKLTGAGAAALALAESTNYGGGEVASTARSGVGLHTLVFRNSYPQLKSIVSIEILGTTAGLRARFTALDVTAKTASLTFEVGAVATDPAATDTVYINLLVRNTNANS